MSLNFTAVLPVGTEVRHRSKHGQVIYRLEAVMPHVRKTDGAASSVLTWVAECPQCGKSFTVTTGLVTHSWPAVRCKNCRLGKARKRKD